MELKIIVFTILTTFSIHIKSKVEQEGKEKFETASKTKKREESKQDKTEGTDPVGSKCSKNEDCTGCGLCSSILNNKSGEKSCQIPCNSPNDCAKGTTCRTTIDYWTDNTDKNGCHNYKNENSGVCKEPAAEGDKCNNNYECGGSMLCYGLGFWQGCQGICRHKCKYGKDGHDCPKGYLNCSTDYTATTVDGIKWGNCTNKEKQSDCNID